MIYDKRMIYLSYVKDEVKVKSAGYLKIEIKDAMFYMDMHVNTKDINEAGRYEIMAESNTDSVSVGMIHMEEGKGEFQQNFPVEEIGRGGKCLNYKDLEEFRLRLAGGTYITGRMAAGERNEKSEGHTAETLPNMQVADSSSAQGNAQNRRDFNQSQGKNNRENFAQKDDATVRRRLEEVRMMPDKWQQLLKSYKQVHPYGDDRLYISIEPKDFIIMSSEYQHLAHNSFLLHGFYNYRHIILGMENESFYLGVPGVFYEREKMVAMMFGFEAFECQGGIAENGKNGYYLKKVRI